MKLYHECLTQLKTEVREKKKVLDGTSLAFMTAEPGLLNQTVGSFVTSFRSRKKPEHGFPN